MSYPSAYCLACRRHTDTTQKHTVILSNRARALKGQCPECEQAVYRILAPKQGTRPKKSSAKHVVEASQASAHLRRQDHQGVVMKGVCPSCHKVRSARFTQRRFDAMGAVYLLGQCQSCHTVMRKNLDAAAGGRNRLRAQDAAVSAIAPFARPQSVNPWPWLGMAILASGLIAATVWTKWSAIAAYLPS